MSQQQDTRKYSFSGKVGPIDLLSTFKENNSEAIKIKFSWGKKEADLLLFKVFLGGNRFP